MAMFWDFFGSSTLFSCSTVGRADFLVASLGCEFAELHPKSDSMASSFNWKELDFNWSQTVARSEVALTLSQCRGFNLGFDPSLSPLSPNELTTLVDSQLELVFSEHEFDLGLGLFDCEFITRSGIGGGVCDSVAPNFLGIGACGSGGGGGGGGGGEDGGGYLQRQGSLSLPRTLSQKTVDEVWNDISKVFGGGKDVREGISGFNMPQKEKTLGEITLEEFLAKAGVVREEVLTTAKPDNASFDTDFSCDANTSWLGFSGYQQQASVAAGLISGGIAERSNQITNQPPNLPLNVNGARSAPQQMGNQKQSVQQAHPQILPKQSTLAFGAPMDIPSAQLSNPRIKGNTVGVSEMNKTVAQHASIHGGGVGMVGVGVNAATGSPAASSDGLTSNGDTSSVSPVPFLFNGSLRGRRSAGLEKVVERRQRRMIKNRESAARSRARKQAYTMELEGEIAMLKEENELLQKKQAEIKELQKNQALERMKQQDGSKKKRLRRTQTGPW